MIEKIKALPLFAKLPPDLFLPLLSDNQLYLRRYAKGATVYNQKDRCGTFDVILSGSLVAYSLLENGSVRTMFEFSRGQMLGANLLFGDGSAYPFTIYCMADAELLHVTKKAVSIFLRDYSFTMRFVEMLSDNSQKLNRKITMATQQTLKKNLLEYLRQQSILQRSKLITLPISKKQLADYLGVQRPSLFRELKNLREEGVLDVSNRKILLNYPGDLD